MIVIQGFQGTLLENESLANYTTWRVGGCAQYLYKPASIDDLSYVIKQVPKTLPVIWLGLGSNTLIRDGGVAGFVILTQGALKKIHLCDEQTIVVDAGVSCASMARFCARNYFAEGEFWAGIPGTMGGALRMNAGCSNGETWRHLVSVDTMRRDGRINHRGYDEFIVTYRDVKGLADDEWFVRAYFRLPQGEKALALARIKALLATRAKTQPTGEYNCGSVFRNPEGDYAARLIESCGLKGLVQGGASVSDKHANFITNNGVAVAKDIEALIYKVASTVKNKTGVALQQEVHIVGEKGTHHD